MSTPGRKPLRRVIGDALPLTEPRRSFGLVLAAIVVAMVFQLAASSGDLTRFITIVLQSTVIVLALRAAGFHRHIVHVAIAVLTGVAVVVGVALFGISDLAPTAPRILTLLLVLLTPAAIVVGVVRELREDKRVTVQTIYCGLSIYLLIGLAFAVLHRDDDLLAVAKPRGLPSIPNGGFLAHTLLHVVRAHFPEATPMHRLGRGTSGLLLFARTATARRAVSASWRTGGVEKVYRALVSGVPELREFTVEAPIGLVDHPRLGRLHAAAAGGKAAVSHVRILAARNGNALAEVTIPTGRPHQIRIHMAAAGHPLVGDPLYVAGGGPAADGGLPGDAGYRLHAHRLRLAHPGTGLPVEIECAPPPELRD